MKSHFHRRRLPHVDKPGAIYFVTACLEGSISARGLNRLSQFRARAEQRYRGNGITDEEWTKTKWKLCFVETDRWLDEEANSRWLKDPILAAVVEDGLRHFAGERYALWAWVVMPSHFHIVFEPMSQWVESLGADVDIRSPRLRIMHSIKRHTARRCNQIKGASGKFWQDESHDHCISDPDELERIIGYVEMNPVKARMVATPAEFRFSSAYYRSQHRIPEGRPLIGDTEL